MPFRAQGLKYNSYFTKSYQIKNIYFPNNIKTKNIKRDFYLCFYDMHESGHQFRTFKEEVKVVKYNFGISKRKIYFV